MSSSSVLDKMMSELSGLLTSLETSHDVNLTNTIDSLFSNIRVQINYDKKNLSKYSKILQSYQEKYDLIMLGSFSDSHSDKNKIDFIDNSVLQSITNNFNERNSKNEE